MMMNGKQKGFTLAEMLIALALIGVISALLVPKLLNTTSNKAELTKLKSATNELENVLFSLNDPSVDASVTLNALLTRSLKTVAAPTGAAFDCDITGGSVYVFPDGSAIVTPAAAAVTNTLASSNATAFTQDICIETSVTNAAATPDGYYGQLQHTVVNGNGVNNFIWNAGAAATTGASGGTIAAQLTKQ